MVSSGQPIGQVHPPLGPGCAAQATTTGTPACCSRAAMMLMLHGGWRPGTPVAACSDGLAASGAAQRHCRHGW
jgi:hypothetical protein